MSQRREAAAKGSQEDGEHPKIQEVPRLNQVLPWSLTPDLLYLCPNHTCSRSTRTQMTWFGRCSVVFLIVCFFIIYHHLMLTYDPWDDKDLHPSEGCCSHAVEQQRVRAARELMVCHVWQQGGACKAVSSIQDEKTQENCKGWGMSHKLHEGATHHFSHLRMRDGITEGWEESLYCEWSLWM